MSAAQIFADLLGTARTAAAIGGSVFAAFEAVEGVASKEAKHALTERINRLDVSATATLPIGTADLFQSAFGARHFSFQCFWRSACFSIAGMFLLIAIKVVSDPQVYSSFWADMHSQTSAVGKLFIAWIFFSIIPDFLNLYKTRVIIESLSARRRSFAALVLLLVADFVLWILLFSAILAVFVWSFLLVAFLIDEYVVHIGFLQLGPPFDFKDLINAFVATAAEIEVVALELVPDTLRFKGPLAVMFYAGFLPSVWLWLYVGSVFVARGIVLTRPLLNWFRWFLDFDGAPFRSVGMIAAVFALIMTFLVPVLARLL